MLLIAIAVELPPEQVPEIIKDAIKEDASKNWETDKILIMRTHYKSRFYAVDVFNGDQHQRLFFDKLGAYKPPPYL